MAKVLENLEGLSNLNLMTDRAYHAGNISEERYHELKGRIKEAQMDNLFAAMAAMCRK